MSWDIVFVKLANIVTNKNIITVNKSRTSKNKINPYKKHNSSSEPNKQNSVVTAVIGLAFSSKKFVLSHSPSIEVAINLSGLTTDLPLSLLAT